jgi:kynurenine formamidase
MSFAALEAERVVDLTHELHEDFPTYIGLRQFSRRKQLAFEKVGINIDKITSTEHVGTHFDAPLHFSEDGRSVSDVPVAQLVVPLCIIDIREKAAVDADARLVLSDLEAWMQRHGPIPANACVAMLSGWEEFVGDDRFRNADADGKLHFPGVDPVVAQYLLDETGAVGLAVDTLSLDAGVATDFPTHKIWLPAGRWGLECVANLGSLPPNGSTIFVGAPKHRGGTGGPARVLAIA